MSEARITDRELQGAGALMLYLYRRGSGAKRRVAHLTTFDLRTCKRCSREAERRRR